MEHWKTVIDVGTLINIMTKWGICVCAADISWFMVSILQLPITATIFINIATFSLPSFLTA